MRAIVALSAPPAPLPLTSSLSPLVNELRVYGSYASTERGNVDVPSDDDDVDESRVASKSNFGRLYVSTAPPDDVTAPDDDVLVA